MDSVQIIEKLICFGLTRQEATLYLCLLQSGELTGYEAAKQTGISRSNAYNALAGLTEKGAAYIAEGTPAHYYALEPEEFCANKIRVLEEMKRQISENIPKNREESEGYLTISGDAHIKDKVKNMILASKKRVYLSMAADVLSIFEKEIDEALEKGRKVVILTDKKTEKKTPFFMKQKKKENKSESLPIRQTY